MAIMVPTPPPPPPRREPPRRRIRPRATTTTARKAPIAAIALAAAVAASSADSPASAASYPPATPSRSGAAAAAFRAPVALRCAPGRRRRTGRRAGGFVAPLFGVVGGEGEDGGSSSFLSTSKATVSFSSSSASPALSPADNLLSLLTSDRTSLFLGSVGILLLLLNRLLSFPEDAVYEASRSRVDLLGVFAAGSVLLNGVIKLDVESVVSERVRLEGIDRGRDALWIEEGGDEGTHEGFRTSAEWALASFLRCSPARTAVLLAANVAKDEGGGTKRAGSWRVLAAAGVLPDVDLTSSVPEKTPILDRMLRDGRVKGGTVGGADAAGKGPGESYLPTLQALPGRAEFGYLPPNAQEALVLPAGRGGAEGADGARRRYAVVFGGDVAKSFAPRDVAWCKEAASWIGGEG
ncbi:hypothetical protein ACHAWF_002986 [Thalassiosira exigua]